MTSDFLRRPLLLRAVVLHYQKPLTMIRLFRKIRQKTLTENNFGKYLTYAIGEIVLVVIGILIALGVNNWNQEKDNIEYEITILKEISNSLSQEIKQIESQYGYLEKLQKSVVKLALYKINTDSPQDSLNYYFNEVLKSGIAANFNYGPYETLKSSGLNKISNDQIRKSIAELYEKELKAVEFWLNDYINRKLYLREDLASKIFKVQIRLDTEKGIESNYIINNEIINTNPDFNKFLSISSQFIPIAKRNLKYASKAMTKVNNLISHELSQLD